MSAAAIQAGGATVVITASDQTAAGVQSATRSVEQMQASVAKVGSGMQAVNGLAGMLQTRFLGAAAGAATISIAFRSVATALEEALRDGSKDFLTTFGEEFTRSFQQLPIVGTIASLLDTGLKAATGALAEEQASAAAAIRNRELAAISERERRASVFQGDLSTQSVLGDIAAQERRIRIDGGGDSEAGIEELRRLAQQRAGIESDGFARSLQERAEREGVFGIADADARSAAIEAVEEAARRDRVARLETVQIEFDERLRRAREEAARREAAAAEAARREEAERIAAAERVASIQGNLAAQIADARLAAEAEGLGDTPGDRARAAEIASERELLRIEERLRSAEERLLGDRRISDDDRERLLGAERELADIQRGQIETQLELARKRIDGGSQQADELSGRAFGSFSAVAASRSDVGANRIQADQLKALTAIEKNTREGATFA